MAHLPEDPDRPGLALEKTLREMERKRRRRFTPEQREKAIVQIRADWDAMMAEPVEDPTPRIRLRLEANGAVVDQDGKMHARIVSASEPLARVMVASAQGFLRRLDRGRP